MDMNTTQIKDFELYRFRTFHIVQNGQEKGRVMAVTFPVDDEKTKYKTQFSYFNPRDKFCRKIGKFLAIARLNSYRVIVFDKTQKLSDNVKDLIVKEAQRKNILWWNSPTIEDLK